MLKLFKNISIYSLGNILNKGVQFLLLPLYTRLLVPGDYGKLELMYLTGSILGVLYGLLVELGYSRVFFDKKDPLFRKTLFATGQAFNLVCAIIFSILIFLNADRISDWFFNFPEGAVFLKLTTIYLVFKTMTHIPLNNIRNREKPKLFITVNFICLLITVALTVFFLVVLKTGVQGILQAQIISGVIELAILYYVTRREFNFSFSMTQLREMLGFSVFIILPTFSGLILNMSNRFFLQEYTSLDDVGLYSLGAKIASVVPFFFTEPVKKAFGPHLFALIDDEQKCKQLLGNFTRIFFAGVAAVAFAIALYSREIIMLMAHKSYSSSYLIVHILTTSNMILGLAGVIVGGIQITKKTYIISVIFPFSAGLNILLNILLIPSYGRTGAAVATLLSVAFITVSYFIAVAKIYPVKFEYGKIVGLLVATMILGYLSTLITFGILVSLIVKSAILAIFMAGVIFSGYFTKAEIASAKQFILLKTNFRLKK